MVLLEIRIPRILLSCFVGASLGLSGASLQGLFRNPLADPGLIGVSAGAALGAALTIVVGSDFTIYTALEKLDVVPRAEFEKQKDLLKKAKVRLNELEEKIEELSKTKKLLKKD